MEELCLKKPHLLSLIFSTTKQTMRARRREREREKERNYYSNFFGWRFPTIFMIFMKSFNPLIIKYVRFLKDSVLRIIYIYINLTVNHEYILKSEIINLVNLGTLYGLHTISCDAFHISIFTWKMHLKCKSRFYSEIYSLQASRTAKVIMNIDYSKLIAYRFRIEVYSFSLIKN